jgi:hypothetical protein
VYLAAWVKADGSSRSNGAGFSVRRSGVGTYQITILPLTTAREMIMTVSPAQINVMVAIVAYYTVRPAGGIFDVEVHDTTGVPADGDFTFIAMERSGS